jgi:chaperonin GroES
MNIDIESIRLLDDRILVQRVDRGEHETATGILIPSQAVELGDAAKVIKVGPGAIPKRTKAQKRRRETPKRRPCEVTVGEIVVINRYAGTPIDINHEPYLILRDRDVIAIEETPA